MGILARNDSFIKPGLRPKKFMDAHTSPEELLERFSKKTGKALSWQVYPASVAYNYDKDAIRSLVASGRIQKLRNWWVYKTEYEEYQMIEISKP